MALPTYRRRVFGALVERLSGPRPLIQALSGPRQVGKTTVARQAIEALALPTHFTSADDPAGRDSEWLRVQWQQGRTLARGSGAAGGLLVLDEIHKVQGWAELVKFLWDEDTEEGIPLRVLLLGSAPLPFQVGLSKALAGRFELLRVSHWSFGEMRDAFGWNLDEYIFYGGYPYPGASRLFEDHDRWRQYILDSLIETSISRDILLITRVDKPALLRQLFRLACDYSGQELAYNKMVGQLQEKGSITTLGHYLQLLSGAGMVTGLEKFSGSRVRQRTSSPKLIVLNTGLVSAMSQRTFEDARADPDFWGRLVETSVGAHLVNEAWGTGTEVLYWRDGTREVDYVVSSRGQLAAVEVTSGRRKAALPGLAAFREAYRPSHELLVGGQGIPVAEFLRETLDGVWARGRAGIGGARGRVRARILLDGEEIDVMTFEELSTVHPGKEILIPDARGVLSGRGIGTRFVIKDVGVVSEPKGGQGDVLVDLVVEPSAPSD